MAYAFQLCEFTKDQIDGGLNPSIRILLDPVIRSSKIANRNPLHQGATLRFLPLRRLTWFAKTGNVHLADRAFHAKQKAIIRKPWIVDGFGIDQQCADHAVELQ